MTAESLAFFFLAAFAVSTAILMVLQRNPVLSAISMIGTFFSLAGLYLLLHAQLLAVLQVVIYTGAIMVLVLFVIMLLNLGDEARLRERYDLAMGVGTVLAAGFVVELFFILFLSGDPAVRASMDPRAAALGTVEGMGGALFGRFVLPFEMTSVLLLVAVVGAVVLAKRKG